MGRLANHTQTVFLPMFPQGTDMILLLNHTSMFSHGQPHKSVYTAMLFLLDWRATWSRDLPQEIESISFHTDTFTSILTIPLRVAGVVNRGEMKEELKLFARVKTT